MKVLSLIIWVTQFGLSILLPPCFFLWIAYLLQNRFGLGFWIMIVFGVFGLLVSFQTAKANLKAMLKEVKEASSQEPPTISFNSHH